MRVKADTYNDETRLKHTVIDALEMDWAQLAKKLITDVESMGGQVPETVSLASFLPPCADMSGRAAWRSKAASGPVLSP